MGSYMVKQVTIADGVPGVVNIALGADTISLQYGSWHDKRSHQIVRLGGDRESVLIGGIREPATYLVFAR